MIHARDTGLTYAAVLTACRLQEVARRTSVAWVVQNAVVRVIPHVRGMIQSVNVCMTIPRSAQVCEYVRLRQKQWDEQLVAEGQVLPYDGHKCGGAEGDETEEEDDNERMLLIHEVVPQAGAAVRDAAIGEEDIELAERRGKVDDE